MKKILAVLIALMLTALCCFAAVAEGTIDFSGYTLEELLTIRDDLTDEIASRPGGEKMVLGTGQYKIGEDLAAGVYTFKFVQNGDKDVTRSDYYVYENESMYKYDIDRLWLGDMPRVEGSLKGDGETRISLYPGEYLSLRYNGAEVATSQNAAMAMFRPKEPLSPKAITQSVKKFPLVPTKSSLAAQQHPVCESSRMPRKRATHLIRGKKRSLTSRILKAPLLLWKVIFFGSSIIPSS